MEHNTAGNNSNKQTTVMLSFIGIALVLPIVLLATLMIVLNNKIQNKPSSTQSTQTMPQKYARSFYMIIREQGKNTHIWTRNLDGKPDFRQVIETNGKIESQQLYVSAEKTLYASQQGASPDTAWTKTENLESKDIGLSNVISGPAVWALQYGVGDQQVKLQQGSLKVTIKSVDQPIDDTVFQTTGNITLN